MRECYLDNSATTKPCKAAAEAMVAALREGYHNPSALYAPAMAAEKSMTACRDAVKRLLTAHRVIFTSGGTESNNLAILGALSAMREKGEVLYSAGEHPSVRDTCLYAETLGFIPRAIPYTASGLIDLEALKGMLSLRVKMLCIMQVNNETGAVQPIGETAALRDVYCPDAHLHVDGVQGFLRLPFDMALLRADSYSLSGHKIHAPKGIGALALSSRARLNPRVFGGGQEEGLRSGTENTPGIAALGAAVACYPLDNHMREMKLRLIGKLLEGIPEIRLNGPDPAGDEAAPHIVNLSFAPVRAETMLHALEGEGILVGNGSACSSKKKQISHVLAAMGVDKARAESAVRFSLSPDVTNEDIDRAADACIRNYKLLKNFTRR